MGSLLSGIRREPGLGPTLCWAWGIMRLGGPALGFAQEPSAVISPLSSVASKPDARCPPQPEPRALDGGTEVRGARPSLGSLFSKELSALETPHPSPDPRLPVCVARGCGQGLVRRDYECEGPAQLRRVLVQRQSTQGAA